MTHRIQNAGTEVVEAKAGSVSLCLSVTGVPTNPLACLMVAVIVTSAIG